jgi:hypothetical protein
MKNRAKTYLKFINEAHVDSSGELHDFNPPSDHDHEVQYIEQAQIIQDWLLDHGADRVILGVNVPLFTFHFTYQRQRYILTVDIDTDEATVSTGKHSVYSDSMPSFIDLVNGNGLDFLNY